MEKYNIIFLSYSGEKYHFLTITAILDFLSKIENCDSLVIFLYTDNPEYFDVLKGKINIVKINSDFIIDAQGKDKFCHRLKLVIIKNHLYQYNNNVIYFDSDMFFSNDILNFINQLRPNKSLMFENEFNIKKRNRKGAKKYTKLLQSGILDKYNKIEYPDMYNAGVIGIHYINKNLIDDAILVCDMVFSILKNFNNAEQFAIALILQNNTEIITGQKYILHYWDIKDFYINEFEKYIDYKTQNIDDIINRIKLNPIPFYKKKQPFAINKIINNIIRFIKKYIFRRKDLKNYNEKILVKQIEFL